jgi:hypothetical protein
MKVETVHLLVNTCSKTVVKTFCDGLEAFTFKSLN